MPSSRASDTGLIRDVVAGTTGAVTVVPILLTLGLLAFAPLGLAAPAVAVLAAFVTATVDGLAHAAVSRTQMPSSGPSSPTALTLATLVALLVASPPSAAARADVADIVALCGVAVLLSGAVQILSAWLGLARLARLVPQPVLAGFMNSVALLMILGQVPLLMILGQVPLLLDLPPGHREWSALSSAHPVPWCSGWPRRSSSGWWRAAGRSCPPRCWGCWAAPPCTHYGRCSTAVRRPARASVRCPPRGRGRRLFRRC